jgi:uncharacterized protein (TIGR00290 family)
MNKIILSWSTGKDCAFALAQLLPNKNHNICGLLTTVTSQYQRVSMHSTREKLLKLQAQKLNLPLYQVKIPAKCSNKIYEQQMAKMIKKLQLQQITHIAFGDIFLADIKKYREQQLKKTNIKPLFPLWQKPTHFLAKSIINQGFKAIITCIDTKKLPSSFIGREYNLDFIHGLPKGADPCGENGEFHSFVYDAPIFSAPINFNLGKIVKYNKFLFIDVAPFYK